VVEFEGEILSTFAFLCSPKISSFCNLLPKKRIKVLGKNGSTEYSKGNKTVPRKVATTRTEDGHKQDT